MKLVLSVIILFFISRVSQFRNEDDKNRLFWQAVYHVWPPIIRGLEKIGLHDTRQGYLIAKLAEGTSPSTLRKYLEVNGFQRDLLAWKDPGEVFSLRKLDGPNFQYHIRLFGDGEIRAHYEYSSEGNPWGHTIGSVFEKREGFFKSLLDRHTVP